MINCIFRKCGRVVCNSCSPHRITIPYQFIVQPPTETSASSSAIHTRPTIDPLRVNSSSQFATLGGGERVRLCNPCVPDPNIAPPQVPEGLQTQLRPQQSHSRSSSLATLLQRPSEPRYPRPPNNTHSVGPPYYESRSRSSTVCFIRPYKLIFINSMSISWSSLRSKTQDFLTILFLSTSRRLENIIV